MRFIPDEERRARLARRHHLAPSARTDDVSVVARDLVGLHGTDPASVYLAAMTRMKRRSNTVESVERALYDERTLVRTLCMRRTMFVVPLDLVPVVQAACTDALAPGERRRLLQMLEQGGVTSDPARWLRKVEQQTLAAIEARGEATGAELSKAVPALRRQFSFGEGKKWAGTVGLSTRLLFLLSTEQRVVRGRPKGSWTSSQYQWSLIDAWLPGGVATMPAEEARAELVRRWLAAFGPATTSDLKWWAGWTVAHAKAALAAVDAIEVEVECGPAWVLPGDDAPVRSPKSWVALLPALDPTTMGWQQRDWYLGDLGRALFDANGNAGPTLWSDGRIVGGWAQRKDGEVVYRVLHDIGRDAAAAIDAAAAEMSAWLGETRVTPRFPTPLQREILA
jgi:hypothetical protein